MRRICRDRFAVRKRNYCLHIPHNQRHRSRTSICRIVPISRADLLPAEPVRQLHEKNVGRNRAEHRASIAAQREITVRL